MHNAVEKRNTAMKSHTLLYHIYYFVVLRRLVELNDEIREAITGRSQISKSTFTVRFLVIRRYQGREWTVCMMYTVFICYACAVYNFLVCFRPVSSLNVLGGATTIVGGAISKPKFFSLAPLANLHVHPSPPWTLFLIIIFLAKFNGGPAQLSRVPAPPGYGPGMLCDANLLHRSTN